MSVELKKYAHLYAQTGLKNISGFTGNAFLLSGEDEDGLGVLARLVAARVAGLDEARAFDEHADIIAYPKPPEQKQSKTGKDEPKQKRYAISVDDIKEIIDSLYLTPFELNRKVYIIENAESMSEICQNKLLKSLEEPPPRVCFVLCATGRLLPTVRSRCNTIELPPFDIATVENELKKYHKDGDAIKFAARASRGNLGLAEKILADKSFADTYETAKKLISLTSGSRMFTKAACVYEKLARDKLDGVLDVMEYLLSDVARSLSGVPTVFYAEDIENISSGFTPQSAALAADAVRTAKRHSAANCMPQAVMDTLILNIMEKKALCQR